MDMPAWAELVAAVLVGFAVAVMSLFGVETDSEQQDDRRVRRIPAMSSAVIAPTRAGHDVTVACDDSSGHV